MNKANLFKKMVSLVLGVSMVFALGCGEGSQTGQLDEAGSETIDLDDKGGGGNHAKGRYMENDVSLPEQIERVYDLRSMEDGSIGLLDMAGGYYNSLDQGETWELKTDTFIGSIQNGYATRASLGRDGSIFACYAVSGEESTIGGAITYQYYSIDPAGEIKQVQLSGKNFEGSIMNNCLILSDGTILLSFEQNVYELELESGNLQKRYEMQNNVIQMREAGKNLYVVTDDTIKCYSLETGEEIVDSILSELVRETSPEASDSSYGIMLCDGDASDTVCIATSKGLFRHILKGSVMEEVIKGEISTMSDPSVQFQGLLRLEDGSFFIAYDGNILKHYTYDSEALAVPENKLSIYSLEENQGIRMAIVNYHKTHTDTYISYEIGMSGEDGVTQEDAIRNLNTAIMSGEGPDILVLDDLPIQSYMEKGILEDLSSIFEDELKGMNYFENITNIYQKEGKILAVPTRFSIPVIMGKPGIVDKIMDLDSFADTLKSVRQQEQKGSLIGAYTEENVLRLLYDVCAPAWIKEDGTIMKEELTNFLTSAKKIYEIEKEGITPEELSRELERIESMKAYAKTNYDKSYRDVGIRTMDYFLEENKMVIGSINNIQNGYSELTSIMATFEEQHKIAAFQGQSSGVFMPNTILGINASGNAKEKAMEAAAALLSEESQTLDTQTGFPVLKSAFDTFIDDPYYKPGNEESIFSEAAFSGEDGTMINLTYKWPSQEQLSDLKSIVENMKTASVTDSNLESVILSMAPDALNGSKDIESVTNEIINKMQIYLSE